MPCLEVDDIFSSLREHHLEEFTEDERGAAVESLPFNKEIPKREVARLSTSNTLSHAPKIEKW